MRHNRRDDGQLSCQKREMKTMNANTALDGHTTVRVLRRAGIAGILPAGVWLCRLQRKFGRFLPAGIFRWFYVFAGWRSFCLSKTDPKRRNALVSILVVAEPSDGRSSSRLKVRLSTRARRSRVTVRVFRTERETITKACVSDHVQMTQNALRHFRSTQCCTRARDLARWRVTPGLRTASIARSSEMRERPSVCRSRQRILKTLRSRVLSTSFRLNVTGRGKVHRG